MGMEFEQRSNESNKAYAAFKVYLEMGPERSTAAVAKQLAKSEQLIRRWSAKFDWTARVQAYGAHLALVERKAQETALQGKAADWLARQQALREREWEMHERCIEAARKQLAEFIGDGMRRATLGDIARILETASKLGRMASGMPTDHTEVSGEVTVTLDTEWELAVRKVYGKGRDEGREPRAEGTVIDVEAVAGTGAAGIADSQIADSQGGNAEKLKS